MLVGDQDGSVWEPCSCYHHSLLPGAGPSTCLTRLVASLEGKVTVLAQKMELKMVGIWFHIKPSHLWSIGETFCIDDTFKNPQQSSVNYLINLHLILYLVMYLFFSGLSLPFPVHQRDSVPAGDWGGEAEERGEEKDKKRVRDDMSDESAPAPPPPGPGLTRPLGPGDFDRSWNDPPLFSYSDSANSQQVLQ